MFDLTKPWPLQLSPLGWLAFALGSVGLLAALYWIDVPVSLWTQTWPEPVRAFFFAITDLGLSDWVLIPSLALFIISGALAILIPKPTPKRALWQMTQLWAFFFIGTGLPGLLTNIIKRIVGRGRPELFEEYGPLSFQNFFNDWTYQSFPSGHSTSAFALCFVVGFISPRWFPWMLLFAFVIGFSRIVVGAHYPTDALGGALVGTLGAYAVRNFFASRGWLFERLPEGRIRMRALTAVKRLMQRRG
jgi:membrane-associated phospholipid phosphatase